MVASCRLGRGPDGGVAVPRPRWPRLELVAHERGKAEVTHAHTAVAPDQQVGGLEVTMHHALLVGVGQPLEHLLDDAPHLGQRQLAALLHAQALHVVTWQVFHAR
jgi:hypothetical protein